MSKKSLKILLILVLVFGFYSATNAAQSLSTSKSIGLPELEEKVTKLEKRINTLEQELKEADEQIQQGLENEINTLNQEDQKLSSLIDHATAEAGQAQSRLNSYRNALKVRVYRVFRGQANIDGWTNIGCQDARQWQREKCPGMNLFWDMVDQKSGDKCGSTYWVFTCVNK